MSGHVLCVPNISEGRDLALIAAVARAASAVPGVQVLSVEPDADHNRTVITFAAPVGVAVEAALRLAREAVKRIDLTAHSGGHPRIGAVDVIPFVPTPGANVDVCVRLANSLGERLARELELPVFLYDLAARLPAREDLANVRRGQFERLREGMEVPDFGPREVHPSAGAVAVGARHPIVNFNIDLETTDMKTAESIAKRIRASNGGFPGLRAKAVARPSLGRVQVSTVIRDSRVTSVPMVYAEVYDLAGEKGVGVAGTEFIGLVPKDALEGYSLQDVKMRHFIPEAQTMDAQLEKVEQTARWQGAARTLVEATATTEMPGGGSVAAASGALAAGLGLMALRVTLQGKKTPEEDKVKLRGFVDALDACRRELEACMAEDAAAFEHFMSAYQLPKDVERRTEKVQAALKRACEAPMNTARYCLKTLRTAADAGPVCSKFVASDMACARHLARASIHCALENVKINLGLIKDAVYVQDAEREMKDILKGICD